MGPICGLLLALAIEAEEPVLWPGVRVVVVGDVAHVTVHPELAEPRRGDLAQSLAHVGDVRLGRRGAVKPPDHHGRLADLALGDPADLVLEEPGRELQGPAEIAVFHADELGTGRRENAHAPTLPHPGGSVSVPPGGRAPPARARRPGARTRARSRPAPPGAAKR